jgi:aminoglycoside 3-N-acetyltransferase I
MTSSKNPVKFKHLTASDLQLFRELNVVFAHAFEDQQTHLSKPPSDEYLKKLLGKDHFIALAAIQNNRVVGGIVAYLLEKYEQERAEAYIYDLAVAEESRRQGIARGMIEALKPIAKKKGARVIFVQADKVDAPAVALYESMGIKEEPFHFDISID